jgi:hypothetical protein
MKKVLTIIIILIIIAAFGFGMFWFFNKQQGGAGSNFNISEYFPFGQGSEPTPSSNGNGEETGNTSENSSGNENSSSTPTTFLPQLWKISENPQSGAVVFVNNNDTFVRYLDKATGNVFEGNLSGTQKKRVTNTTIPKVYETVWASDGNSLVLRYAADNTDTIKSLYAKLAAAKSTTTSESEEDLQELQGTFLPSNISQLATEPGETGKERAFYLLPDNDMGSAGFIANLDGAKSTKIFDSALHEWLVSWPKKEIITYTTKSAAEIPGYLYFLNSQNGSFKKVLGDVRGLTTLTKPDGLQVLYSESGENIFSLGTYTLKTAMRKILSQKTLPEKCVWSKKEVSTLYCGIPKSIPANKYPDVWYQGLVSFSDAIWKVNASTSQAELLIDPKEKTGVEIDATNLILDKSEKYLLFTNKKDSQLWGLRLLEN